MIHETPPGLPSLPVFGFFPKNLHHRNHGHHAFFGKPSTTSPSQHKWDSIHIIQRDYINRATPFFKKFLEKRNFTSEEYVNLIGRHPKFWTTIRPLTENIANRKPEIESVLDSLAVKLPNFKRPDVCFAIGCIRTGGTTSRDLILIGSEIAASDASVDKTGMNAWHQSVIGNSGDIVAMIAHEAVHTQEHGIPFGKFLN